MKLLFCSFIFVGILGMVAVSEAQQSPRIPRLLQPIYNELQNQSAVLESLQQQAQQQLEAIQSLEAAVSNLEITVTIPEGPGPTPETGTPWRMSFHGCQSVEFPGYVVPDGYELAITGLSWAAFSTKTLSGAVALQTLTLRHTTGVSNDNPEIFQVMVGGGPLNTSYTWTQPYKVPAQAGVLVACGNTGTGGTFRTHVIAEGRLQIIEEAP